VVLYWKEEVNVTLLSFSLHHIDVRICDHTGLSWRSTFVYGEPKAQDRPEMWKLLRIVKKDVKKLGLCWETSMKLCGSMNICLVPKETKDKWKISVKSYLIAIFMTLVSLVFHGRTTTSKKEGIMLECGWIEQLLARVGLMPFLTLNSSI
jgi:hypothetical protein